MSEADQIARLSQRLAEAEATLEAIRSGQVDALVVEGSSGQHVYALESADLPYRQFLEQMGEGALSFDPDGVILFCNRFFAELVGVPRDSLLGAKFDVYVSKSSRSDFTAALGQARAARVGLSLRLSDGRPIPVQLAMTPVGEGDALRWTVVVTDLSERERVRELTAAREAAEAASLAKDQFLAAVGHELRSPLNAVMGWTNMLLDRPERYDAQVKRGLEVIERNAKIQVKLIEDLLDISRVVSGKLAIERKVVDLSELAKAAVASALPAAQGKGVTLEVLAPERVFVLGDAQRLTQVFTNLLGNAQKFTPAGGTITLTVKQHNDRARVVVQDDGQGIDEHLLPQVFQLFRQGQDHGAKRASGLGLGLSITKHLMDLHEGQIWAESAGLGKGATFSFELAAVAAPLGVDTAAPAASALVGVRALLVDDENDTREVTARVLRKAGAEVVTVCDAEAALARIDADRFDLVVSDLMMPGTDGWELARQVRIRYGTRVPLLAVTGLDGLEDRRRAHDAGFDAFLTKPLQEGSLAHVRENLLSSRSSSVPLR